VDFLTADVSTELLHGKYDVLFGNLSRRICVELVKYSLEARFGKEVANVDSRSQELRVIDLIVVVIVHLIDHLTNFSIT